MARGLYGLNGFTRDFFAILSFRRRNHTRNYPKKIDNLCSASYVSFDFAQDGNSGVTLCVS